MADTSVERLYDEYVMTTVARLPISVASGKGALLWDTDGKEYIDLVAGIAVCLFGHAPDFLVDAVTRQLSELHHVSNLYYIPQQAELAKFLVEQSCCDKAFFCNSGAEANEAAIKLTRKFASSVRGITDPVIITAEQSFHGRTLATVTATGQPKYHQGFAPLVQGFRYVPYNDLGAIEALIEELDAGGPRVAAVLLEPLQGEGGVRPGEAAYFQRVRELCTERGILLIMDEVQTGVARSGAYWGYEHLGIEPDMITTAKGLGAGFPIGALLAKSFCSVFQPGEHSTTYGGSPLACAVALTVGRAILERGIIESTADLGERFRSGCRGLQSRFPNTIVDVRGWGLINGIELAEASPVGSIDVVRAALPHGLLILGAGPKVLRFVPPLIISGEQLDEALRRLALAFQDAGAN